MPKWYGWQVMRIAREKLSRGTWQKSCILDKDKTKRIVFHEITKSAILKAIDNPRGINYNLGRCPTSKACAGPACWL